MSFIFNIMKKILGGKVRSEKYPREFTAIDENYSKSIVKLTLPREITLLVKHTIVKN